MRCLALVLAALVLLGSPTPAAADQTNPRLDALFAMLQQPDPPGGAAAIESRIWAIWYSHDDPRVMQVMSKGAVALARGHYQEAIRLFTRVTELAPDYAEGWNRRATAYFLVGRYHDSLADIARVLTLAPRHFGALSGRGLCLRELGKPLAAIEAFEAALEVNPHLERVKLEIIRLRARLRHAI